MQFNNTSGNSSPTDLIPNGVLVWALLTFRGMKNSQETNGRYADLELTVGDNQPFARRKIWTKVADPDDENNSEKWRNMGMVSLTRMVEAAVMVDPKNPATYELLNGKSCQQVMMLLDGKYVAVKVKIENGKDGHADKNAVGDFLTPNEQSSGFKGYVKLTNGDHGATAPAPQTQQRQASTGFAQAAPHAAQPHHPQPSTGFHNGNNGGVPGNGPFVQQPAPQQQTTSRSETAGFNPNKAPAFLSANQK